MPSRKRNKGRERKAKRAAAKVASSQWRKWARRPQGVEGDEHCNHGCATLPAPEHTVSRFMNAFDQVKGDGFVDYLEVMELLFEMCPEVWNEEEYRTTAINILLTMGTNMILHRLRSKDDISLERHIGVCALLLESYDGESEFNHVGHSAMANEPVFTNACGKRDILKFYSKRLRCSCLKEQYKQARKTLPKVGGCLYCGRQEKRASLMTCGHCKVPFYCSRECQVFHWPTHKRECALYAKIQKRREAGQS